MKHPSSRELFAHWTERRGPRPEPERGEIEPAAFRRSLGDAFILGTDFGAEPSFRLAGTRVCALFGRELRNEAFAALWPATQQSSVRHLLSLVGGEAAAIVAGARGRTPEGFATDLELLLLPLRHRGKPGLRMLGVLAPMAVPFWLGSSRLESLALGGLRHLGTAVDGAAPSRLAVSARPRLVVHDGGRP